MQWCMSCAVVYSSVGSVMQGWRYIPSADQKQVLRGSKSTPSVDCNYDKLVFEQWRSFGLLILLTSSQTRACNEKHACVPFLCKLAAVDC